RFQQAHTWTAGEIPGAKPSLNIQPSERALSTVLRRLAGKRIFRRARQVRFYHVAGAGGRGADGFPALGSPSSRSTRLSSTAFVATMIEESDMSSADHSGRSSIPKDG